MINTAKYYLYYNDAGVWGFETPGTKGEFTQVEVQDFGINCFTRSQINTDKEYMMALISASIALESNAKHSDENDNLMVQLTAAVHRHLLKLIRDYESTLV